MGFEEGLWSFSGWEWYISFDDETDSSRYTAVFSLCDMAQDIFPFTRNVYSRPVVKR